MKTQRSSQPEVKPLKKICAWCHPGERGDEHTTHGICPACFKQMMATLPEKIIVGVGNHTFR